MATQNQLNYLDAQLMLWQMEKEASAQLLF